MSNIECMNYKPMDKGMLRGFCSFFVPRMGLEITNCTHHQKGAQEWVNLPSREYTKEDGTKAYAPIVKFREKNHQTAFQAACLEAVHKKLAEMPAPAQTSFGTHPQYVQDPLPF